MEAEAQKYYQEALEMRKKLFPVEQFPAGHPHLAVSTSALAWVHTRRREYDQAEKFWKQSLQTQVLPARG